MALQNLSTFSVVGVQERLGEFERMLRSRLDLNLQIARVNVTRERDMLTEINIKTLERIHDWIYMDLQLYEHVLRMTTKDT
jgi:hypothetical protein